MGFKRYKMLQKYINGEAQEEYKQGELIDDTVYSTLDACNDGNEKPDEPIYGVIYQWVDTGTTGCLSGDKYTIEKEQISYDGGATWADTGNTRRGNLLEVDSDDCLQYRWIEVQNDYICVGSDKYTKEKEQSSNDDGVTWTDTGAQRTGEIIQSGSTDCNFATQYFTIEALEDMRVDLHQADAQYSMDNGETWTWLDFGNYIRISAGNKVLWRSTWYSQSGSFGSYLDRGRCIVYGNVMSLLYGENFEGITTMENKPALAGLFNYDNDNLNIVSAENLVLPATTLTEGCYSNMFNGCTNLVSAPAILPATTLARNCYGGMFKDCTSLKNIPILPATTLAINCYQNMFNGCTSLTTAPALPVMTLEYGCYYRMFANCTSLTTAPTLPSTTLADYCYGEMFRDCTSLINVPSTLPATTLTEACYSGMFFYCTSLTTAPELPATTLVRGCYTKMFNGCSELKYVKAMFTSQPSASSNVGGWTYAWLAQVASGGTFIKNSEATWTDRGTASIPKSWSIQLV